MMIESIVGDYFWIMYLILEYLYGKAEKGEKVNYQELLGLNYHLKEVNLHFIKYILTNLEELEWIKVETIETKTFDHLMHEQHAAVDKTNVSITHEGIIQLQDNQQFKELMYIE